MCFKKSLNANCKSKIEPTYSHSIFSDVLFLELLGIATKVTPIIFITQVLDHFVIPFINMKCQ